MMWTGPSVLPSLQFKIEQVGRIIRAGGVVAYPTEGVWGLGCDPWNPDAVGRILNIKSRTVDKGLILIGSDFDQLAPWLDPLSADQILQLEQSWPGPNTWVIPHNSTLPEWVSGGRNTIAVRVPGHPLARALCSAAGTPIVSTSANRSGRPGITDPLQIRLKLGLEIDAILPGHTLPGAQPSQIRDLATGQLLRA